MTSHDELVDAGAQAMHFLFVMPGTATNRGYAAAVVDAVEPLIREDERKHQGALFLDASGIGNVLAASIQEAIRADLAAKVEALPRPRMANDAFVMDERWDLWRAKVLALIGGGE